MADDRSLNDRLAEEFASGDADLTRAATLATIPPPGEDISSLTKSVRALKSAVDGLRGYGATVLDKALTARDMLNAGTMAYSPSTGLSAGAVSYTSVSGGSGGSGGSGYVDPRPAPETPPNPSGVSASGGFRSVIVVWNSPGVANHAYTEVWRFTADNLATATANAGNLIGQPTANIFEDTAATPSVPYFYWVRHVNTAGTTGAYSSSVTAGALLIAGVDFGPLVIEAAAIKDGAVIASKIADAQLTTAKFASGIEPVTVVTGSTVPTVKSTNSIYLTGTGKMYRWNGTAYTAAVPTTDLSGTVVSAQIADGSIVAAKIADAALTTAKFASGIEPLTIVTGTLPTTKSTNTIFRTDDSKTYRWNGTAYVATVATTDLTGTITDAQVVGLAASKVTGQLSDTQIAAVAAAKVTGTLVSSQIADAAVTVAKFASGIEPITVVSSVPGTKSTNSIFNTADGKLYRWNGTAYVAAVPAADISGTLAAAQIASLAASQITGQLTNAQLADLAATKITGQLSDTQLAAISAAKISGQIATSQIADAALTTAKFASTIEPITLVTGSTLPTVKSTNSIYLTGTGKLYRWVGAAYSAVVDTSDLNGTISDAQLAGIAASKITGQLSDTQIAAIGAAKLTGQIVSTQITDNAISTAKLAAGAVTAATIAADTITAANIAANAITSAELAAGAVVAGKIAAGSIQAADIAAGTITGDRLAANTITASQIAADTITAGQIATGAIGATEIAAGAITTAKLAAGAVTATEIAAGAITTAKIAAGAITSAEIAAGTITAADIAAGTITAAEIASGAITTAKLAAGAVTANEIASNAITAVKIDAGAITTAKLAAGAVTANEIAASTITGGKIAAGTITGSNIAADTITAGQIAAGAISASEVAAGSITVQKLLVAPVSLCPDPYFSDTAWWTATLYDANGWYFESGVAYSGTAVQAALWAGHPTNNPGTARKHIWSGNVTAPAPGTNLRLRARVRNESNQSIYVTARFYDGGGGTLADIGVGSTAYSGQQDLTAQGVVPNSASFIRFIVYNEGATTLSGAASASAIMLDVAASADLIVDGAITAAKVQAGAITTAKLAAGAVTANEIASNAITAAKIDAGAITTAKLAAGAVTANEIAASTITGGKIAAGTITGSNIAADTITAGQIAAGAINASEIAAGAISTDKLAAGAVTANEIASNAITAAKIEAGAITTAKLAAGAVTANEIAASTITGGKIAANTITGSNIAADTITAGQIAAGAISASEIAAGAISTDKLLVTGKGAALNDDPGFSDASAWGLYSGVLPVFGTTTDGKVGSTVARSSTAGTHNWINVATSRRVPVDPNKAYRLRAWARTISGSGSTLYVGLALFDSSGTNITGDGSQWSYAAAGAVTVPADWTPYRAAYGAGTGITIPANARTMSPLAILSYGGGTSIHEVQDLRIEEMASADLIVDGAIVASKLSAGSIAVGSAAIAAGAITNAMIADATIDTAKIGNLNAVKINAGTLSADRIAAGSLNADKITAGTITADRMFANVMNADNVLTRGLTVRDGSGNIILSSGTALTEAYADAALKNSAIRQTRNLARCLNRWTLEGTNYVTENVAPPDGKLLVIPAGSNFSSAYTPTLVLSNGTTYTVSFVAWTNGASRLLYADLYPDTLPESTVTLTSTPTLYKFTWTPASADAASCILRFFAPSGTSEIYIHSPQLEFGAYTPWKPANEDVVGTANQITSGNASTYIADAAIGAAKIGVLTAGNLTVGAISNTINGATTGDRVEIVSNVIRVWSGNVVRVKIGNLA